MPDGFFVLYCYTKTAYRLCDGTPIFMQLLQDADAACAVGILVIQQIARVIGQRCLHFYINLLFASYSRIHLRHNF